MAIVWTEENASQEAVNSWIHGIGFLASIPAAFAMYQLVVDHRQSMAVACVAYSITLTLMYLFSTLSHSVREPALRNKMRALDQGFVYTLIAGTFTPFICGYLDGWLRVALLSAVWVAAGLGFYTKVFAKHRIDNMTSLTYVALGWIPSMVLVFHVSIICFAFMALGGVVYTLGVLFLQNDHRAKYFHAIWHIMVILASACHYGAIAMFVVLQMDH